jgi:hypothetical protein
MPPAARRATIRAAVEPLREVQYGDMMLDVVALLYEALVKRSSSQHAAYMAALPLQYTLPTLCK